MLAALRRSDLIALTENRQRILLFAVLTFLVMC
jgi:hypothetical protein